MGESFQIVSSVKYGSIGNDMNEAPKCRFDKSSDPFIGRKVWTRWPEDNNFYESVIGGFDKGRHALVYDAGTPNETWEWVNLREISPNDIRWKLEDVGISHRNCGSRLTHWIKKFMTCCGISDDCGIHNGIFNGQSKKELPQSQNRIGKKALSDIHINHTSTFVEEYDSAGSNDMNEALKQGLDKIFDPLIGRKVWLRWPDDNNFYESVISDFNEGRHALVYDTGTPNETWEWVNFGEISPNDKCWKQEDVGISHTAGGM